VINEVTQLLILKYRDFQPIFLAVLLLFVVVGVHAKTKTQINKNIGYKVGQIAPEFKLKSLAGKTHTLASLRSNGTRQGHVLLVFWAVECVYCYAEVKDLNAMHSKYNNKGLTIAAINIGGEYDDDVAEYVKDNNIKYLILSNRLDNLDAAEAYHSIVTPTLVLVSPEGKVVYYGHSLPKISKFIK